MLCIGRGIKMKIIHLKATEIEKILESVLDNYETGIDSIAIAVKKPNAHEVHTAYLNATFAQKAELISHLNVDLIDAMIQENYVN